MSTHNLNGAVIRELKTAMWRDSDRNASIWRSDRDLSLQLILLITFNAIDFPVRFLDKSR